MLRVLNPTLTSVKLGRFIRKWRLHYALLTVAANLAAILVVLFVFPDVSNLWVSLFVLFGSFSASLTGLADLLDEE